VGLAMLLLLVGAAGVAVTRMDRRRRRPPLDAGSSPSPGGAARGSVGPWPPAGDPRPPRTVGDTSLTAAAPGPAASGDGGTGRRDPPAVRPLPELVAGIDWPCGLAPHVAPDQPDTTDYLTLTTSEDTGSVVTTALTAELERLGYEWHDLSEGDLVARRGEDLLSIRVHPRAEAAATDGRRLFPAAPPTAVVVEAWAGGGPRPLAG
jgi:hypothetical protein